MIQRHLGARVSLLPLLVGTYAPDALTKWFVYGIEIGGIRLAADDPAQFHRGCLVSKVQRSCDRPARRSRPG